MIKIVLIGAGLIGRERLKAIQSLKVTYDSIQLVGIYDPFVKNIKEISKKYNTSSLSSLDEVFDKKPDWVFIATPHDLILDLVTTSLNNGCEVLVEKPLGRSLEEAKKIMNVQGAQERLWVGFNYRFYKGIYEIISDIQNNKFGDLISINFMLGHGGNPSMKDSWKLDYDKAGGGCLIDPGIHLLDLCRIISGGNIEVVSGIKWDGFWNKGIEEECHLLLRDNNVIFNIQTSIVRWKSTFVMEVNGTEGYGRVIGRNRSYGNQSYIRGKKWGWMKGGTQQETEEKVVETDGNDVFARELESLLFPKQKLVLAPCSGNEALSNMELFDNCLKAIVK